MMMIEVIPTIMLLPNIMDNITPATTIVDEWSNDDTGVGPSIAIGNQYLSTHRADFLKTANIPNIQLSIA